ncbi:MAG TPA: glycosyltransferase family 4 protein, partial [Methylophilaceae bacterium]|nr:glycosyltransferase family 4 protein [Methylophilaceae bacterium]
PCFAEKMHANRGGLLQLLSGRNRWFVACERAVFAADSRTEILSLSEREKHFFQRWYATPEQRFHPIQPFLAGERLALQDKTKVRQSVRQELGFGPDDYLILMVGSGFRMKGLDRAIEGVAALPPGIKCKTRLVAVGQDNPKSFQRMVSVLRLGAHVQLHPGRDDIPQLMQAADLLVHPARRELAGHVLLEAMASGLPVLASGACGFGFHISKAEAGVILPEPYRQADFNREMANMLVSPQREAWSRNGVIYARSLVAANDGAADVRLLITLAERKQQLAQASNENPHVAV